MRANYNILIGQTVYARLADDIYEGVILRTGTQDEYKLKGNRAINVKKHVLIVQWDIEGEMVNTHYYTSDIGKEIFFRKSDIPAK